MRKVFICSRYHADETRAVIDNVRIALFACAYAAKRGYAPYAPHLYLPRCLNDNDPSERELGLDISREFLAACDELWQWGVRVSDGMAAELALAEELGIPIKRFDSLGFPCPERKETVET